MSVRFEIGYSRSLVDKAEARLTHQLATVQRLGRDADPRVAATANETLAVMRARLVRLRANHADLLRERGLLAPASE